MKEIFTSNYARNAKNVNAYAISIFAPRWYKGKHLKILAPTWEIVKEYKDGLIDEIAYTKHYITLLKERELTPEGIIELIPHEAVLLCYESPKDFCHRRVLAEWIFKHTGFVIPELLKEEEKKVLVQKINVETLLSFE